MSNWVKKAAIALTLLFTGAVVSFGGAYTVDGKGISRADAQALSQIISEGYGMSTPPDEVLFNLGDKSYVSLQTLASSANTEFGRSQRLVVSSLYAFGASMENSQYSYVINMFKGLIPVQDSAIADTADSPTQGILAAYVIVPTLLKVFITMDIYLVSFFKWQIIFIMALFLTITMGISMLQQMHEGRIDYVGWCLKGIFAAICMLKANVLCNFVLAAAIGLAAIFNASIINGITSQNGIDNWYLQMFGPQLVRNTQALIVGKNKAGIAKAFEQPRDMYNISRFILYENGKGAATSICKYMGGAEGYNEANGVNAIVHGVPLKELSAMFSMSTLYNIGLRNLEAHKVLGDPNADTDILLFKRDIAQLYLSDESITVSDTSAIDGACNALQMAGISRWAYLQSATATYSSLTEAAAINNAYAQPGSPGVAGAGSRPSIEEIANMVRSRSPAGFLSTLWSTISGAFAELTEAGKSIISYIGWLPSSIVTLITQGALQQMLLGGLLVWLLISMALCKLGVILVALTSPLIMLEGGKKYFWGAMKTMCFPALYPAFLIIIMQMTSALSSWIGTISGMTLGVGMVLNVIPLIFGLVSIIALPKIVKVMLSGGNMFIAQMKGSAAVVQLAGAAAVGAVTMGAGAAVAGGAAAGGAAAGGAAAGGAAAGGAAAGGAATGGAATGVASAGATGATAPISRAVASVGRVASPVMRQVSSVIRSPSMRTLAFGMPGWLSSARQKRNE